MSLDIRTTYLNWVIGLSLGLALWYRNTGADRPLGGFLIAISLVFLIQYGLVSMMSPQTAGQFILGLLVLSLFVFIALTGFNLPYSDITNILLLIAAVYVLWALYTITMTNTTFSMNIISWERNGMPILGCSIIVFVLLLFIGLFLLTNYHNDVVLGFLSVAFLLLLAVVWLYYPAAFGYYFCIILLFILFIYWIAPFFQHEFNAGLVRR